MRALLPVRVGEMTLAQIGPLTTAMESLATAVGAGMVLAAFGTGAIGSIAGWPRLRLEGGRW